MFAAPLRLYPTAKNYAWGKLGHDSLVARMLLDPDPTLPYAELWLGAHARGPSFVQLERKSWPLDQLIQAYPEAILGQDVIARFGVELPFLLKVESVRTALSIQIHPDKQWAEKLFARDRLNYPDGNHKPELAVAITPVELLCGFRELEQIREALRESPELRALGGEELTGAFDRTPTVALLAQVYRALMTSDSVNVMRQCEMLHSRLRRKHERSRAEEWVLALSEEYPKGDVGLFSFFLLNLVRLEPGAGIYLPPRTPHSYLCGDLIECMATSDNVIRAGLTPKHRDVEALLEIVEYAPRCPKVLNAEDRTYRPPVSEFVLDRFSRGHEEHETHGTVEILLSISGVCRFEWEGGFEDLTPGDAFLVPAAVSHYALIADRPSEVFRARVGR